MIPFVTGKCIWRSLTWIRSSDPLPFVVIPFLFCDACSNVLTFKRSNGSGDLSYLREPLLARDRRLQRDIEQAGRAVIRPDRAQRRNRLIALAGDEIIAARAERADLRQI